MLPSFDVKTAKLVKIDQFCCQFMIYRWVQRLICTKFYQLGRCQAILSTFVRLVWALFSHLGLPPTVLTKCSKSKPMKQWKCWEMVMEMRKSWLFVATISKIFRPHLRLWRLWQDESRSEVAKSSEVLINWQCHQPLTQNILLRNNF